MTDLIVSITSTKLDKNLLKLEGEIRLANKSFLVLGKNLTFINERKLYTGRGFGTFELYVSTMFDFTRDYAYKIMNATRIYNILAANFKPSELPCTETHCRPLTKIEKDEDIIKIWLNVANTGKIIAKTVTEMVNLHLGKGAPTTPEPETTTEDGGDSAGNDVEAKTEEASITAEQKVRVLEAKVTQLENDLQKARAMKGGIAKTKMAREMIQKGFAALSATVTDEQREELIATKKALLG